MARYNAPLAPFAGAQAIVTPPATVNELLDMFTDWARDYYKPAARRGSKTYNNIDVALRRLREAGGNLPPGECDAMVVRYIVESLAQRGDLARRTINDYLRWIKFAFRWAAERRLIPAQVYAEISLVRNLQPLRSNAKEPTVKGPVDWITVRATLPHMSPTVADMVQVQWFTGMRSSELCSLRPCDIDRSQPVWIYRVVKHKTARFGKVRLVAIGRAAQEILSRYLDRCAPQEFVFAPKRSHHESAKRRTLARVTPPDVGNSVGTNRKASPRKFNRSFSAATYYRHIVRACDRAFPHPGGLSSLPGHELNEIERSQRDAWQRKHRFHPHQLRRAAATKVRRELGLDAARVVLGHSGATVTELYAEADLHKAVEAMELLG